MPVGKQQRHLGSHWLREGAGRDGGPASGVLQDEGRGGAGARPGPDQGIVARGAGEEAHRSPASLWLWAPRPQGWAGRGLGASAHLVQVMLQLVARVLQLLQAAPKGQVHRVALQPQVLGRVPQDAVNEPPQVEGGQALALGALQVFLCELGPGLRRGGAVGGERVEQGSLGAPANALGPARPSSRPAPAPLTVLRLQRPLPQLCPAPSSAPQRPLCLPRPQLHPAPGASPPTPTPPHGLG